MRKFEYTVVEVDKGVYIKEVLNTYGADGWKVCDGALNFNKGIFLMEREITPEPGALEAKVEYMQPVITEESLAKIILGVLQNIATL